MNRKMWIFFGMAWSCFLMVGQTMCVVAGPDGSCPVLRCRVSFAHLVHLCAFGHIIVRHFALFMATEFLTHTHTRARTGRQIRTLLNVDKIQIWSLLKLNRSYCYLKWISRRKRVSRRCTLFWALFISFHPLARRSFCTHFPTQPGAPLHALGHSI